jgi:hypothetical protein
MKNVLPGEAETRMDEPYLDWTMRLPEFTIGNQPDDERMWTFDTLDGTRSKAESFIGRESTHRRLLPYFQTAAGDRDVDTGAFKEYVFTRGDGPVRDDFRSGYGNEAVAKLKSKANETVTASTRVDTSYKDRLLGKVAEIAFHPEAPAGGRISFPTERPPDHTRYRPKNIQDTEKNGIRTVIYETETGQRFTSTINSNNGLTMSVEGRNLSFMTGRGVTENSRGFTPNNGFDRSHIIANEFGGSGFAAGANLVTASAHYNQQVMRHAERQIGSMIRSVARDSGRTETEVSFTMTVTVTFGALRDPAKLAEAKSLEGFPADRVGVDLDAEILQKIKAGLVHPDLMRISGVLYSWTFTDPPDPTTYELPIGADLWLLTHG